MKTEMFTTNSCFKSGCPRHKWWWGDLATSCLGWGMVAVSHCARKGAGLSQLFLLQAAWHLGAWSQRYWLKSSVLLWESTDTEKSWILMDIAPCLLKTSRKGAFHALSQKLFHTPQGRLTPPLSVVLVLLALCPFYLIPVKKYHLPWQKEKSRCSCVCTEKMPLRIFADYCCHQDRPKGSWERLHCLRNQH